MAEMPHGFATMGFFSKLPLHRSCPSFAYIILWRCVCCCVAGGGGQQVPAVWIPQEILHHCVGICRHSSLYRPGSAANSHGKRRCTLHVPCQLAGSCCRTMRHHASAIVTTHNVIVAPLLRPPCYTGRSCEGALGDTPIGPPFRNRLDHFGRPTVVLGCLGLARTVRAGWQQQEDDDGRGAGRNGGVGSKASCLRRQARSTWSWLCLFERPLVM